MNRAKIILCGAFIFGLLSLQSTKSIAQRNIEFFEPDFDSVYCINNLIYKCILPRYNNDSLRGQIEGASDLENLSPAFYNQFFSATCKNKKLKAIVKNSDMDYSRGFLSHKKLREECYFNLRGYLVKRIERLELELDRGSVFYFHIDHYEYDNDTTIRLYSKLVRSKKHAKEDTTYINKVFKFNNNKQLCELKIVKGKKEINLSYHYSNDTRAAGLLQNIIVTGHDGFSFTISIIYDTAWLDRYPEDYYGLTFMNKTSPEVLFNETAHFDRKTKCRILTARSNISNNKVELSQNGKSFIVKYMYFDTDIGREDYLVRFLNFKNNNNPEAYSYFVSVLITNHESDSRVEWYETVKNDTLHHFDIIKNLSERLKMRKYTHKDTVFYNYYIHDNI